MGDSAWAGVAVAAVTGGYALFSRRLASTVVSAPMVFTGVGVAIGPLGLDLIDLEHDAGPFVPLLKLPWRWSCSPTRRPYARDLRLGGFLPSRLLTIGLPLTIGAGWLLAWPLLPGLTLGTGATRCRSCADRRRSRQDSGHRSACPPGGARRPERGIRAQRRYGPALLRAFPLGSARNRGRAGGGHRSLLPCAPAQYRMGPGRGRARRVAVAPVPRAGLGQSRLGVDVRPGHRRRRRYRLVPKSVAGVGGSCGDAGLSALGGGRGWVVVTQLFAAVGSLRPLKAPLSASSTGRGRYSCTEADGPAPPDRHIRRNRSPRKLLVPYLQETHQPPRPRRVTPLLTGVRTVSRHTPHPPIHRPDRKL